MFKRLREDIDCIYERDPAARSRWEILTCYPGLHAILMHRLAHKLWRHKLYWLARFTSHISRIFTGIEIHPGAQIGNRVFFDHGFGIVVGETAVVGDDCTIYQGVTLGGTSLYKGEKRHPTLEDGVVVGAGAQILGGFTVGAGAKVGSNAVVVKPIPAGATAVGNPSRIIVKDAEHQKSAEEHLVSSPERGTTTVTLATKTDEACTAKWRAKPLHELLERSRQQRANNGTSENPEANAAPTNSGSHSSASTTDNAHFAAYAVDQNDNDPLIQVIHELVDHIAQQDARINKLCHALEDLGQRVENGAPPLDKDRLNKMME